MDLTTAMHSFLERTQTPMANQEKAWSNAWAAGLQHNPTYTPETTMTQREEIRGFVRNAVEELSVKYAQRISESEHEDHIVYVAHDTSSRFKDHLRGGRFRIGTSQKVLNLYLKFQWCFGSIPEPPHCPLDRIVQQRAKIKTPMKWTSIDDISEYRHAIDSLRSPNYSLAVWELQFGW